MKIIVLLAGMTRGGIDLFQSLLDNHPQVSQLPGKFYVDDFLKKINKNFTSNQIADLFIKEYKEYFDSRLNIIERHNNLGPKKNEFYIIDEYKFKNKFIDLFKNKKFEKKNIILNLHLAYSFAAGENIQDKKILILQIHHFFRIQSIVELDFDIICTIRDPIASHSSYVKNLATFNKKLINPWQYYYHIERNFSHIINLSRLNKNINVIKLERLHKNNSDVMQKFCKIYEINYIKALNSSTFHGKLWWGDQVSKNYLNGINKKFENKIDYSLFFKSDIETIEYFLENFIKSYNYTFKTNKQFFRMKKYLPFKVDQIIFLQSLKKLNIKNLALCIYYYFKRLKLLNKKLLDMAQYPSEI